MTGTRRGRSGRAPRDADRWARAAPARPTQARPTATRRPAAGPPDEALPPRDRGPLRAYVRDLVDARRSGLVSLFVPGFGGTMIAALGPASSLQRWLLIICSVLLAVAVVDALLLGRSVVRRVRARFPDVEVDGPRTGWYAFMRAHRMRSMRLPRPQVDPGERIP
jgi:Protein of unknown function (DUF3043)